MKKILVLCLCLQGCVYQSITAAEVEKALDACKSHGGLVSIYESLTGRTRFNCYDNTKMFESEYKPSL